MERWRNLKNRIILWHGSRTTNFLGILSSGLQIAPDSATINGHMFGKGVYFADVFQKSLGYCSSVQVNNKGSYSYLLLCEVALGEMSEVSNSGYITSLTGFILFILFQLNASNSF